MGGQITVRVLIIDKGVKCYADVTDVTTAEELQNVASEPNLLNEYLVDAFGKAYELYECKESDA